MGRCLRQRMETDMNVLICIDDTDNLDSPGTGELMALLADAIAARGWGTCGWITRHQLFVHPDIPYTSHNSAMCMTAELAADACPAVIDHAAAFLTEQSAPGSDPGLCVVAPAHLREPQRLVVFGQQAKQRVLSKSEAYDCARAMGVHLSEHGGSGLGVIGALAGAGLRLGGNDGRLRGSLAIQGDPPALPVEALCQVPGIEAVRTLDGQPLPANTQIRLGRKVKTILRGGRFVLLVSPLDEPDAAVRWQTCTNQQLKAF
jgi:hypothetical protein